MRPRDTERTPPLSSGPEIPDWVDPRDLDPEVRGALRSLEARNAQRVAAHLVAAGTLVDEDPEQALAHARAARDRASRIAAVREAVGVAAYHAGDFAEAARELRAYRRMSGDEGYRAVLADCERALGRPEVALRLVREALDSGTAADEATELRLVEAGARAELGELPAALLVLEGALGGRPRLEALDLTDEAVLRLATAYADLLTEAGRPEAEPWQDAVTAAQPEEEDVVFGEADLPADLVLAGGDSADDEGPVATDDDSDDDLLDLPGVSDADIEAEVAELLGETGDDAEAETPAD
ncbi:tetratricopeptide repeat protein [Blastococcus sp. TF02A-26]|uniref:tetratricopeptide repeat protein n=1 Tax=Blastococcus sp. TF02A-26 TaxID=2250577 RepID=UPI000DEA3D09|nr:tetratricopeptide repeat protein [Blastococcus sp. TF02A-26]RBY84657.1 tetratricopeptide repeat protein [Blastococcus sp. TF02A-26]